MIPPISSVDLETNPLFAELWKILVTHLLEHDSSRRQRKRDLQGPGSRESETGDGADLDHGHDGGGGTEEKDVATTRRFREQLDAARARTVKAEILRELLSDLPYRSGPGPGAVAGAGERDDIEQPASKTRADEGDGLKTARPGNLSDLRDLILLVSSYLDVNVADSAPLESQDDSLAAEIARFQSRSELTRIADAMSHELIELDLSLCELAGLATVEQPSLAATLRPQLEELTHLRTEFLPYALSTLTSTLHELLTLQRELLAAQVQRLEASKHGVLSRHSLARMAFLEAVATAMSLKCHVLTLEAQRDLGAASQSRQEQGRTNEQWEVLHTEESKLDERIDLLQGVLGEFDAVDPRGAVMKPLGKRYAEIEEEMERVKSDIAELRQRQTELGRRSLT